MEGPQSSDLYEAVKTLVQRFGAGIVTNADNFRAALDDWAEEDDAAQAALLTDAVRYGAVDLLQRSMSVPGSDPSAAIERASEHLTKQHGGINLPSARWAVAVLGSALNLTPDSLVTAQPSVPAGGTGAPPDTGTRPESLPPPAPPPLDPGTASSWMATEVGLPPSDSQATRPPSPPPSPPPFRPSDQTGQSLPTPPRPPFPPSDQTGQSIPTPPGPPVPPTPPRTGSSKKAVLIVLAAVVAVVVIVGGVLAATMLGKGSDNDKGAKPTPTPTTPASPATGPTSAPPLSSMDVQSVAAHFAALGNFGGATSCRPDAAADGYTARVICTYADFDVELSDVAEVARLENDRQEAKKPNTKRVAWSDVSTPAGTFVQQVYGNEGDAPYPNGASELYWDSTDALQSATVLNQDQHPGAQGLRDWYNSIGSNVTSTPFDGVKNPFQNVDLWVFYKSWSGYAYAFSCTPDVEFATENHLTEAVDCSKAAGNHDSAAFGITDDVTTFRRQNITKGGCDYDGDWHWKGGTQRTEGKYCTYANEDDTGVYAVGYVDDEDTDSFMIIFTNYGDNDAHQLCVDLVGCD